MLTQIAYAPMGTIYDKSGCLLGVHVAELQLTFDDVLYPFRILGSAPGKPCALSEISSGLLTNARILRTIDIPFNVMGATNIKRKSEAEVIAWAKCTPEQKATADLIECKALLDNNHILQYSCKMLCAHMTYIYDEQTKKLELHMELSADDRHPLFAPIVSLICSVGEEQPGTRFMKYPAFALLNNDTVVPLDANVSPILYAIYKNYATDSNWFKADRAKNFLGGVTLQLTEAWREEHMASVEPKIAKLYMSAPKEATINELLRPSSKGYSICSIADPLLLSNKAKASSSLMINEVGQHTINAGTTAVTVSPAAMSAQTFVRLAEDTRYLILDGGEWDTGIFPKITAPTVCLPRVQCINSVAPQLYGLIMSCYTAKYAQIVEYLKLLDTRDTALVRMIVCNPEYQRGTVSYVTNTKRAEIHIGAQPADAVVLCEAEEFVYSFCVTRKQFQVKLQGNDIVKRGPSINRMKASLSLYLPQELKNGMQLLVDLQDIKKGTTLLSFVDPVSHLGCPYNAVCLEALEGYAAKNNMVFGPSVKTTPEIGHNALPDMANAHVHLSGNTCIELCGGLNLKITATSAVKNLYLRRPHGLSGATIVHIYANVQTLYLLGEWSYLEYYIHGEVEQIVPLLCSTSYYCKIPMKVHVAPQQVGRLTANYKALRTKANEKPITVSIHNGTPQEDFSARSCTVEPKTYIRADTPIIFGKRVIPYGKFEWTTGTKVTRFVVEPQVEMLQLIPDING